MILVESTPRTISFSNSELETFKSCRRRWMLSYYMGFRTWAHKENPTSSARLGTRLHAALEGLYGHGIEPRDILRAAYRLAAEEYPSAGDELAKEMDFAFAIIDGYHDWLEETGADSDLTPLGAERVETAYLADINGIAVYVQARLDAVFRRGSDGAVIFMDHKSVGSWGKEDLLPIDSQMKTQYLIQRLSLQQERSSLPAVEGVIFNMLKRSKRTARAAPPFYKRVPHGYNKEELRSMWRRVWAEAALILQSRAQLDTVFSVAQGEGARNEIQQVVAFPTPSGDCSWKCPFVQVCPMMDDGSRWEGALEAGFQRGNPYEYLDTGLLDRLIKEERL